MRSAGLALLVLTACGTSVDRITDVHDLRVLAVRTTPAEVLNDAAVPPATVDFEALVLNPQGGDLSFTWRFCPIESTVVCHDFATERARAGANFYQVLDDARAISLAGEAQSRAEAPELSANPVARPYDVATFSVPYGTFQSLDPYFLNRGLFGYGMGAWPEAVLELQSASGDRLTSVKRIVYGVGDLAKYNVVIKSVLGYALCVDDQVPTPSLPCVPFHARAPNNNPEFLLPLETSADTLPREFVEVSGIPELKAGETLRILPRFTDASYEPYQFLRTDLQTSTVSVDDRVEDISVSWFTTAGRLQDAITWPKFTKTLDTAYTAPSAPPTETLGLVTIYLVARDQRGGTSWTHLDVRIVE